MSGMRPFPKSTGLPNRIIIFFCGISLGDDYLEGSSHYKCWTLPYNSGSTIDIPIVSFEVLKSRAFCGKLQERLIKFDFEEC